MRGVRYYYSEFQRELDVFDASVGEEFRVLAAMHSPREVFLWLEQRRSEGRLPSTMENLLTDFYWEIA
jgi:hypothetical protein